ncbi:hypothetical protein EG348_05540 [Chryseobacterium sp. G0201]|nr:hypothetical protein EG348_05540 [Chryseobacterium sp. G0201]
MDGIADYIEYVSDGVIKYKNSVYLDVDPITLQYDSSKFTSSEFAKVTTVTFKKNNFVKNSIGIVIPHKITTADPKKPNYEFQVYSVDISNSKLNFEYSKVIPYSIYNPGGELSGGSECVASVPLNVSYLDSYDYNGDGISELMIGFSRRNRCTSPAYLNTISNLSNSDTTEPVDSQLPHLQPQINSSNVEYGDHIVSGIEIEDPDINIIQPGGGTIDFFTYYSSFLMDIDENTDINNSTYKYDEGVNINNSGDNNKNNRFADLNGDGIQDIIQIKPDGTITNAYNFRKQPTGNYVKVSIGNFSGQILNGIVDGALYGDFNGDSKMDVLVPQADKSYNWNLYVSDGKKLNQFYLNNFIFYSRNQESLTSGVHNTSFEGGCGYGMSRYFQYNVSDLDGDGKSEIIVANVLVYDHAWNAHRNQEWTNVSVAAYSVNKLVGSTDKSIVYNPIINGPFPFGTSSPEPYNIENTNSIQTNSNINFYRTKYWLKVYNEKVIPFSILTLNRDNQQIILTGKPVDCVGSECDKNYVLHYNYPYLPLISRIVNIRQGEISTDITYRELNPYFNTYRAVKKEQFPYYELDRVPLSSVVERLTQWRSNNMLIQDFKYRGLLTHFQGKGMIGFRQTARSSWYANGFENTKIWAGAEMDPLNEAVPIKEWSIRTNDENKIFPTDISENNTQLLSFKSTNYQTNKLLNGQIVSTVADLDKPKIVTAILPVSTKTKDFLTNSITNNTLTYGDYYLPAQSISNVNNGYAITTSTFEYFHNLSGTGAGYFVGRPKSKTDMVQAYGDTKSAKEEYVYEDNLLKTLKTWNRDNTGYLQETYNYDGFGNITGKIISNSIDSQTQTTTSKYDSKGRFVVKKSDNLGLITNIIYNDWGLIEKQTDPLGNTLTNTYDNWGKLLKSKTNLGGTTTYTYEKDSQSNVILTQYDSDGDVSKKYTNTLGQNYKSSTKAFGQGQFVSQETQYDAIGRKLKESEPYFEGQSANQWNVIAYDDSVFPAKVTATSFSGKQMETNVSGNITTVKELNGYGRTNSKTTDALGNVVSSTDKGGTIQFAYNAAGEQIKAQYAENIVTTKYDSWGRKSEFNDPSNGLYKYEYDGFGQPKKIISPKGTKEFAYNNLGQLISQKEISTTDGGQATNKTISYAYDDKGRVTSKSGTSKGKAYSSNVVYDPQGRMLSSSESSNGKYFMQKGITYDDKARVISYEKQLYSSGTLTKVQVENVYSAWNGELYQVKDKNSGKVLWELQETNAKGQVLRAKLGAANINNTYDANGFLTNVNHSSAVKPSILQLSYSFDAVKNELKSRTTGGDFNIVESFDYDDNNRLVNWTNPVTGIKPSTNRNVYDVKGRIMENDQVGTMKYENSTKIYQPTGMTLNAAGTQNYNNDLIQSIAYNENNDPVFIDGMKGDVAFQYGLTSMRQRVTYGGNFSIDGDGKFTKFYSEDGSFEVVKDNVTGKEKHVLYIGGNPYESNIIYLKNYDESTGSYKFLHKDYIGSILAISDEAGNKLEQRHFDAWGNFTHLQISNGPIITDKNIIDTTSLLVERGYTSHEHFAEVGIIHMNGRLYDPLLRRFLNADENIQDPYNTQIYNKYGYVMNNPLMYNDPSGEIFGLIPLVSAMVVGAIIGVASYVMVNLMTGQSITFLGLLKSTFFGAVSGAVTFGIGSIFTSGAGTAAVAATHFADQLGTMGTAFVQAGLHAVAQGTLSLVQGGSFGQAFVSGALGSLGASAFGVAAKEAANTALGTIAFGSLAGGFGSALTGGNFWQGALIGGVVAGLNHVMHMDDMQTTDNDDEFRRNADGTITATGGKKGGDTTDYLYDVKGKLIGSKSVTVLEAGDNMSADYSIYGLRLHTEGTGLSVSEGLGAAALEFSGVSLLKGLGVGAKYLLSRTYNNIFKLHPRLTTPSIRGFGHGQFDAAHRGTAFVQKEIFRKGTFGIKNYNTVYFNHTIGNQTFSTGINPWKRTIFHQGPGVFK